MHYVAAPVPLLPGETYNAYDGVHTAWTGHTSGRYVVRFRSDALRGYMTAWLLWPDSNVWPRDGAIAWPKGDLDSTMSGSVHHMNGTSGSDQDASPTSATYTSWHTAVLEWSPTLVTFTLDGVVIGRDTNRVPSTLMHWVLQTETSTDRITPADTTAGHVDIEWVVAYLPA